MAALLLMPVFRYEMVLLLRWSKDGTTEWLQKFKQLLPPPPFRLSNELVFLCPDNIPYTVRAIPGAGCFLFRRPAARRGLTFPGFTVLPDQFAQDPNADIEDLFPWNEKIKELCKLGV